MGENITKARDDISTQTLPKVQKNMNARSNQIETVNGGYIEQNNTQIKLL